MMLRQPIGPTRGIVLRLLSVLVLLGLYTALSYHQHQKNPNDTTIPSWSQLAEGVKKIVELNPRHHERWIVVDSEATLTRLFLGLGFGVFGAFILGLAMGCSGSLESFFLPPLSLLAKVPPTAALAVFFVMVGTELEMYVTMVAFGILPTLAQGIYLSVRDVPEQVIHKSYTLGASHFEVIWNVIVRQILPKFIDAVRLQIGPAMVYLIAAEMVCAGVGFGYRIRIQFKKLDMDVVYPYLLLLAVFGYLLDWLLVYLQRRSCPWFAGNAGASDE
jgi:NitT/TauT family transport system permease protein